LTEAIRINPRHADAYYLSGVIHTERKDHAKAVTQFNEAIKLKPRFPSAYFQRSRAHKASGDESRSRVDRKRAIQLGYLDIRDEGKFFTAEAVQQANQVIREIASTSE